MKRTRILVPVAILSIALLACRLSDARSLGPGTAPEGAESSTETTGPDSGAKESTGPNLENGANSLFIGHSFFIPVAKAFDVMASRSDFSSHQAELVFAPGQAGSPGRMWESEKNRQQVETALAKGNVDLFGMPVATTPNKDKALGEYRQWIDLALTYNPETRFFIGQFWMARGPSMEDQKYADLNEQGARRNYEIVQELRAAYPNNPIYFINYGKIAADLKIAFSAGELPDIEQLVGKDDSSLFVDDKIGHGGRLMHELCALTWANLLYEAEIEEISHSAFSEEAQQILMEAIEYNAQYD
jgi:hypothetical protein